MMSEDTAIPLGILTLEQKVTVLEAQLDKYQLVLSENGLSLNDRLTSDSEKYLTAEKYRILIENANDAILVAQDNKFAFYNQRTAELTGYLFEELRDLPFINLIHPDDRVLVATRYQKRLSGDEVPDIYTFRAVKKNGEDFWVEIRAVRIDWMNRPAVLCFLTDISRYKITETFLAESEQRYRNIVELSPYGIVTIDTKGVILSVNSAFLNLTGYQHNDFVGRHLSRIPTIHLHDIPRFVRLFAKLIMEGFDKPIEFSWIHKDGTERWGEARGVLLRSDNRIKGIQGIIRDITEQRRAALLLETFNRTALAVAQQTKPRDIFTVMGEELVGLGIASVVLLTHDDGKYLVPAYVSYKSRAIQLVERLVRVKADEFKIDVANADVFKQVIWNRETVIAFDPLSGARQVLPVALQYAASQLIQILDIKTSVNAPLIIEDKVIGMLSVQSEVLRKVDVPTITAFANLMAAALHKARLLDQAQTELGERRKAEGEILRLQRLLQNITDSMPSALITLDLSGTVLTSNPAANNLLNREVPVAPGMALWQIDPAFEMYEDLFDEVSRTQDIVNRYHQQVTTQDTVVYLDIEVFPLVVESLQGVVFRIDNVTEYVRMQDMMLQSAKLASLGGLAAGVAHEINNPLAAMIQSAQMIHQSLDAHNTRTVQRMKKAGVNPVALQKYAAERHLLEYVEGIREAGGRAAKIVTDLLAFSRKSPSAMSPANLNDVIETALNLAATDYNLINHFDFRDIEILRNFDGELPLIVCDQQQIQQVVLNLLINAAQAVVTKFDQDRTFHPRIIVNTVNNGDTFLIVIEDNGAGIDASALDHIFEPFYTTKQLGEGTGLGLWLCWSIIVERHHGKIWVEPVSEGGVRFLIELPVDSGNSL